MVTWQTASSSEGKCSVRLLNPPRGLWPQVALTCAVLLLQLLGEWATSVTYVFLMVWAFVGAEHSIQALTLSWLVGSMNPGVFGPVPVSVNVLRWGVIASAFLRVLLNLARIRVLPTVVLSIMTYGAVMTVTSLVKSSILDVSLFKLMTFLAGSLTVVLSMHHSSCSKAEHERWFEVLFVCILLAGIPLIRSDLGYYRNGRGFQGLLRHPQQYAVFLAPMIALYTGRILGGAQITLGRLAIVAMGYVSLWLTQARVGMIALLGGGVIAMGWGLVASSEWRTQLRKSVIRIRFLVPLLMVLIAAVANVESLYQGAVRFAFKRSDTRDISEAFYRSRGFLMRASLNNFLESPLLGIGFAMPSDPENMVIERDPFLGLPSAAPVEKGSLVSVILEEGGIVGALSFLSMLIALLRPVFARNNIPDLWLCMTALSTTLGEAMFFSMGGTGIYLWLLLALSRREDPIGGCRAD